MRSVVVVVVLGAVTSLAVAWSCSLLESALPQPSPTLTRSAVGPDNSGLASFATIDKFGSTQARLFALNFDAPSLQESGVFNKLPPDAAPWVPFILDPRIRDSDTPTHWLYASGWPFHCVLGASLERRDRTRLHIGVVFLLRHGRAWICTHPYWPGLTANTGIYAAGWWITLFGFTTLRGGRRHLRARRGLCPTCAYDLRHDLGKGCPECGWRRAPVALTSGG